MKQTIYHIYHNPRCSKSRKTLELLKQKTTNYEIIKYLEVGINKNEFTKIVKKESNFQDDILRKSEIIFKSLNLHNVELNIEKIIDIIISYPILLQRPLVVKYVKNQLVKSIIARPPEEVLSFLD